MLSERRGDERMQPINSSRYLATSKKLRESEKWRETRAAERERVEEDVEEESLRYHGIRSRSRCVVLVYLPHFVLIMNLLLFNKSRKKLQYKNQIHQISIKFFEIHY